MNADLVEVVDTDALAEIREYNAETTRRMTSAPPLHTLTAEQLRKMQLAGEGQFRTPVRLPQARVRTVPGRAGQIPVRVLRPTTEVRGLHLNIHGGGFTRGAAELYDARMWRMAEATGLCAVSVDYRLAPESPYPAGLDDCEDVALWLLEHGPDELATPRRLTIGGDSAGANLAALTVLRLRDRHQVQHQLTAVDLLFGVYDLTGTPSMRANMVGSPHPTGQALERAFADYLPGRSSQDLREPEISPLYADLRDLPPAIFTVGTLDPLLDDSMFMAARWRAAGNQAELRVWPEAMHGFANEPNPVAIARAAQDAMHAFLRAAISRTAT